MLVRIYFIICFTLWNLCAVCQTKQDSFITPTHDSLVVTKANPSPAFTALIAENQFLNSKAVSEQMMVQTRVSKSNSQVLFYSLLVFELAFAFFIFLNRRFVADLFRLFFNASLRQSQITDQLKQEEFPSLVLNFFFSVALAVFIFIALGRQVGNTSFRYIHLLYLTGFITFLYLGKFIILKLAGWATGLSTEANIYTFIVFLVNKIAAFGLVPLCFIVAFTTSAAARFVVSFTIIFLVLLLITRFLKTFSVLKPGLKINYFHLGLYVFGLEILPMLLLFKAGSTYFSNLF